MPRYKAEATIAFPDIDIYLDRILDSLGAHNIVLHREEGAHRAESTFGMAWIIPGLGQLSLKVEATDAADFNRLKHDLTGLIDFTAREKALSILWSGDEVGPSLPPDLRVLIVKQVEQISPRMRRVLFEGRDLAHYAVPDQIHGRLLFQAKGVTVPEWPKLADNGHILWPQAGKLSSRIFTIRRIDAEAGTLVIDFFLHESTGPASAWARDVAPGDIVGILGPAAYGPKAGDWYLLAGDETGLPGIARILEDLPPSARGMALIEVADEQEIQALHHPEGVEVRWLLRHEASPGTTDLLIRAIRQIDLPADRSGIIFWGGMEFSAFREARLYLRKEAGLAAPQIIAFSHWKRGMSEEDIVEVGASVITA